MSETAEDLGVREDFPNGSIYYRDRDHSYWVCHDGSVNKDGKRGRRLTSVSTLVSPFSGDPSFLMNWAAELTLDGVAGLLPDFSTEQVVPDRTDLKRRLEDGESTWSDLQRQAADRGNLVHEYFEALAGARHFPDLTDADEREILRCNAVSNWWKQAEPYVLNVEQMVYSSEHGYAGRFDLRFKQNIPINEREHEIRTRLLDLKTGSVYGKALVQLQGYDLAAIECGIGGSDDQLILQVTEDGKWREIVCDHEADIITIRDSDGEEKWLEVAPATHQDFLDGLKVYRRAGQLDKIR